MVRGLSVVPRAQYCIGLNAHHKQSSFSGVLSIKHAFSSCKTHPDRVCASAVSGGVEVPATSLEVHRGLQQKESECRHGFKRSPVGGQVDFDRQVRWHGFMSQQGLSEGLQGDR